MWQHVRNLPERLDLQREHGAVRLRTELFRALVRTEWLRGLMRRLSEREPLHERPVRLCTALLGSHVRA